MTLHVLLIAIELDVDKGGDNIERAFIAHGIIE